MENGGYAVIVNSDQIGTLGKFRIKIAADCLGDEIKFFEDKIKEEIDFGKITEKERALLKKM